MLETPLFGMLIAAAGYALKALVDALAERYRQSRREKRGELTEAEILRTRLHKAITHIYRLQGQLGQLGVDPVKPDDPEVLDYYVKLENDG